MPHKDCAISDSIKASPLPPQVQNILCRIRACNLERLRKRMLALFISPSKIVPFDWLQPASSPLLMRLGAVGVL
jgi:hypothetical protein